MNNPNLRDLNSYVEAFISAMRSSEDGQKLITYDKITEEDLIMSIREAALENYEHTGTFEISAIQFKKLYYQNIYDTAKKQYDFLLENGYISITNGESNLTSAGKKIIQN